MKRPVNVPRANFVRESFGGIRNVLVTGTSLGGGNASVVIGSLD